MIGGPRRVLLGVLAAFAPGLGCGGEGAIEGAPSPSAVRTPPAAEPPAVDPEQAYLRAKGIVEAATGPLPQEAFARVSADLAAAADAARDPHLRANASLLLGSVLEERGERARAISFYRQALAAVPQEASAHAVLALALAADGKLDQAATVQARVVELVPDDLEARLLLGEMSLKAGLEEQAKAAYAAYEMRRKGLIDGLTLGKDGSYAIGPAERAACAAALEPAADNGTALALLYALSSEPDAGVRTQIARVMGTQRLLGYRKGLEGALTRESDEGAREAVKWALDEIARDGVETAPGPSPVPAPPDPG
jgi:tetratricopeptide (TPR) repeat protein